LRQFHQANGSAWTLGLFLTSDTERYLGVRLNEKAQLVSLVDPLARDEVWANAGVYLVSAGALDPVAEEFQGEVSLEGEIIPALLERKLAIYGMRHNGRFIDIGIPADYRRAVDVLRPAS
jgi:NDP-sugar pyrophosphorylase family protein